MDRGALTNLVHGAVLITREHPVKGFEHLVNLAKLDIDLPVLGRVRSECITTLNPVKDPVGKAPCQPVLELVVQVWWPQS